MMLSHYLMVCLLFLNISVMLVTTRLSKVKQIIILSIRVLIFTIIIIQRWGSKVPKMAVIGRVVQMVNPSLDRFNLQAASSLETPIFNDIQIHQISRYHRTTQIIQSFEMRSLCIMIALAIPTPRLVKFSRG